MTYSRDQRKKMLHKGPSTKTLKKKAEKLQQERLKRLKTRPQKQSDKKPTKTHRNDLCPCNSGKKFKQCCFWGPDAAKSIENFLNKLGGSKYARLTGSK